MAHLPDELKLRRTSYFVIYVGLVSLDGHPFAHVTDLYYSDVSHTYFVFMS